METISDIIDRLGGTSAVAAGLALTPSTVSSWKTSGSIPSWRRPAVLAFAKEKGELLTDEQIAVAGSAHKIDQQAAA